MNHCYSSKCIFSSFTPHRPSLTTSLSLSPSLALSLSLSFLSSSGAGGKEGRDGKVLAIFSPFFFSFGPRWCTCGVEGESGEGREEKEDMMETVAVVEEEEEDEEEEEEDEGRETISSLVSKLSLSLAMALCPDKARLMYANPVSAVFVEKP